LNLFKESDGSFSVTVEGLKAGGESGYTVRIAKLGFGLVTKVDSGENAGETLKHDFVVLDWNAQDLTTKSTRAKFKFTQRPANASKYAVVAWIEKVGNPTPLQATGGFL
jgi:hypothetical protein